MKFNKAKGTSSSSIEEEKNINESTIGRSLTVNFDKDYIKFTIYEGINLTGGINTVHCIDIQRFSSFKRFIIRCLIVIIIKLFNY